MRLGLALLVFLAITACGGGGRPSADDLSNEGDETGVGTDVVGNADEASGPGDTHPGDPFGNPVDTDMVEGPDHAQTDCTTTRFIEGRTFAPSAVALVFMVQDCHGNPVTGLTEKDFVVTEDGAPLSVEAARTILPSKGLMVFVSLVLDMSSSTAALLPQLVTAAKGFVTKLMVDKKLPVQVGIELFAGSPDIAEWQSPNVVADMVLGKLDGLSSYVPEDPSSTNLNGAVIESLASLKKAEVDFESRNQGGAVATGFLVLFTDGRDTSAYHTDAEALTAIGQQSGDQVVVVGLQSPDYDAESLKQLAPEGVVTASDSTQLASAFDTLADRVAAQLTGVYLLGYCSPKRNGSHAVAVTVKGGSNSTGYTFDATGFTEGCTLSTFQHACDGKDCGGLVCGYCDDTTAECDSGTDKCDDFCLSLSECGAITNPLGYSQTCPNCGTGFVCDSDSHKCVCAPGTVMCADGECRNCCPDCSARVCGDDGCGGSCGTCQGASCSGLMWTAARTCVSGQCNGGGGTQSCDDGISCTTDSCTTAGCTNAPKSGNCLIEGACYSEDQVNPLKPCLICTPSKATTNWSNVSDGVKCEVASCSWLTYSPAKTCSAGQCVGKTISCDDGFSCTTDSCAVTGCANTLNAGKCLIGGTCFSDGQVNPSNTCQSCKSWMSTTEWTDAADSTTCQTGSCSGLIWTKPKTCLSGTCKFGGDTQNCGDGLACTTDYCSSSGCTNIAKTGYCAIGDSCYLDGTANPDRACQVCASSKSATAWSNATDGIECHGPYCSGLTLQKTMKCLSGKCVGSTKSCDDGLACTSDSCSAVTESCGNSLLPDRCLIGKVCYSNGQSNAAAQCQYCDASVSKWEWQLKTGNCLIDGYCYSDGQTNPGNPCLVCISTMDSTGWSSGADGAACPAMPGYNATCNAQNHCEYANVDATGWRKWDIWVRVPSGSFSMGSPSTEGGHSANEEPSHSVSFNSAFLLGKYEVTVLQYEACMSLSPSTCTPSDTSDWDGDGWGPNTSANGRATHPQNGLTWDQAGAVCAWLGGRLPSEAEWEYAATGPVHRKYPWGDTPEPDCDHATWDSDGIWGKPWGCDQCTTVGCSGTSEVGTRPGGESWAGALDMAGNVWEWCQDCLHKNYTGAPGDGEAWTTSCIGPSRVFRGGTFDSAYVFLLRSSGRNDGDPSIRYSSGGARCVKPSW